MTSQSINSRTGKAFGPIFMDTSSREIESIVEQAKIGFKAWEAASATQRAHTMNTIADAIDGDLEALIEIANLETGLGIPRLNGEVARTTFQIREFAKTVISGQFVTPEVDAAVDGPLPSGHPELI